MSFEVGGRDMSEILRVGIAGLGTVGAAVVRLLDGAGARSRRPHRPQNRRHRRLRPRFRPRARDRSFRRRMVRRPRRSGALGKHRPVRRTDRRRRRRGARKRRGGAGAPASPWSPPTRLCSPNMGCELAAAGRSAPRRAGLRGLGRRRHSHRQDPARGAGRQQRSRASMAFSTAPAITSCRAWSWRACPSPNASTTRKNSAMPRPIRPSTSAASTPRTSSPSSPRSPSA